jgi:hypothetical protein
MDPTTQTGPAQQVGDSVSKDLGQVVVNGRLGCAVRDDRKRFLSVPGQHLPVFTDEIGQNTPPRIDDETRIPELTGSGAHGPDIESLSAANSLGRTGVFLPVDHDVPDPRATGRAGSELHSDHDPGNSAASTPTAARAAAVTLAVTPEPQ